MFNNGRTIFSLDVDNNMFRMLPIKDSKLPINRSNPIEFSKLNFTHSFHFIKQGGKEMWQQNIIHAWSLNEILKVLPEKTIKDNSLQLIIKNKSGKQSLERLHRFEPFWIQDRGNFLNYITTLRLGYGINYNIH